MNNDRPARPANPNWGGRFSEGPSEIMERINASIAFDQRLYAQDIAASKAHAQMLVSQSIISAEDGGAIAQGLDTILREIESGSFKFSAALEDIHMNVEARLRELIGPAAGRLHTARSRNDQVATDFRLWVRDAIDTTDQLLQDLQAALLDQAEANTATLMPGFTHLQTAQPVTFGHHLMAYVEMFGRDRGRFRDCRARVNESPLGAAALAGTSFPIDRAQTAKALAFDRPMANSLDAVSARDFAAEYLAAASITATHVSRMAEEIVLWCTSGFDFIELTDAFTTGSSIMPQKRNPDAAELARAKPGRIVGSLVGLLTVLKGLPLAYSKDMQEDKEPVFDAFESLCLGLQALAGMVRDMKARPTAMAAAAGAQYSTATDLADWLVRMLGMPFREAHGVVGAAVAHAAKAGQTLAEVPLDDLRKFEPRITDDVYSVLSAEASAASRTSLGGTAPERVQAAVTEARQRFLAGESA